MQPGVCREQAPTLHKELFGLAFNSLIPPPLPDQWQHSNFTDDIRSTSKTTIKLLSALIDILALTNPSMCSINLFKRLASLPVRVPMFLAGRRGFSKLSFFSDRILENSNYKYNALQKVTRFTNLRALP